MTESNYNASKAVKELDIYNTIELEDLAKEVMPHGGFDYLAGASGEEYTKLRNVESFKSKGICRA